MAAATGLRRGELLGLAWDLVFTGRSGLPLTPDVVSRWFRQAVRTAGLRPLRLHDLRHTHATLMLQAGVPVKVDTPAAFAPAARLGQPRSRG